ncbi:MAG: glycosyltransferase [Candidatus Omnitrophota bacterium]
MVSIIMPVYNGEQFLSRTINSVLSQTCQDFELICVDDGSRDDSRKVIESFGDKRIIYIYQENSGSPSHGRNVGIKISRGEYIAFIDQDDIYTPDSLAKKLEFFRKDQDCSFVYSDCVLIDENDKVLADSYLKYRSIKPCSGICFKELFKSNFIAPQTVMVKKTVFNKVGFFDEELKGTDDYDMFLRIAYNLELGFLDLSLAKWRTHSSSLSKRSVLMDVNHFKTLKKMADIFPECRRIVGINLYKGRLFDAAFDVAHGYFIPTQRLEARRWLLTALKYKFDLKILLKLMITLIPGVYNRITAC